MKEKEKEIKKIRESLRTLVKQTVENIGKEYLKTFGEYLIVEVDRHYCTIGNYSGYHFATSIFLLGISESIEEAEKLKKEILKNIPPHEEYHIKIYEVEKLKYGDIVNMKNR